MNFKICYLPSFQLVRNFRISVWSFQKKNHYDCLGITPKATQGDVKTAYYKLSKVYHPDLNKDNPAAAQKFRDITAAYEILGNLNSRKVYDRELLVRGGDVDHEISDEPLFKENYKHASFYYHRNRPGHVKTFYGKGTNYNIDEWTKAHYSETFKVNVQKRYEAARNTRLEMEEKADINLFVRVLGFVFCSALVVLFYSTDTSRNYDTPTNSKEQEKHD